jgi:hypothetical protein
MPATCGVLLWEFPQRRFKREKLSLLEKMRVLENRHEGSMWTEEKKGNRNMKVA